MDIVERVKRVITSPKEAWAEIKAEQTTIQNIYTSYACILAAISAIAMFIGYAIVGTSFLGVHFRWPIGRALGYVIFWYILSLAGLALTAYIADLLAPSFGSQKNFLNAFKAVTYSMTPVWVAGILYIIPFLSILVLLAGLYGLYLLFMGLPELMETPKDKAIGYVIVVIVVNIVVFFVISAIVGAFFSINTARVTF
ncbi:MAG: Yip1 family protein [Candidatus Aminicenantia bacterium]